MSKKPSPNDQRSVTKNPNSDAYRADIANRQALGHPVVPVAPAAPPQPSGKPTEDKSGS